MSIGSGDIKKLWGLAAGRCSFPGCDDECIKFAGEDATTVGEMAHVIAQSPKGPRGVSAGGADTYANLILLCPSHHREVDKAPDGKFPPQVLLDWKRRHEEEVSVALRSPILSSREAVGAYVTRLLAENAAIWKTYGPESAAASSNPTSNVADLWEARKLAVIVPNNRKIINVVKQNAGLFPGHDYRLACEFVEHAEGFERNCYVRTENVPRFPRSFSEMIEGYAQEA